MRRCLDLALHGLGSTYPNPLVGCVIVYNGSIIGEGWHQKAGGPHAEVNAINSVKDKRLLTEATLYVNLEPCSHYGRTPPCADLIIRKKIKKVVIGVVDSNEKVSGQGIRRLEENGVAVISGILEKECRAVNKRFFTFHEKHRPYIILKWAQSADAFIFPDPEMAKKGEPVWISNSFSRQRVHVWRSQEASILVGKHTVLQDNPRLNVRDIMGQPIVRIAIDKNLEIPEDRHIFDNSFDTIIFNAVTEEKKEKVNYVKLDFSVNILDQIMHYLYEQNIQSLIVEGGAFTLKEFLKADLWDEARVFCGAQEFNGGIEAPKLLLAPYKTEVILGDHLYWYRNLQ
jgi:diaminohydroxyphosphoribosylaminopyrimidine deaminase/5-amino-6-(5-phosphoribosylamino)uracil reductase